MSVDYDDLLNRLRCNRETFVAFYTYFNNNRNLITREQLRILNDLNKNLVISKNYNYRKALYYKCFKNLLNSERLFDLEVIDYIKTTEAYIKYPVSDDEILSFADFMNINYIKLEDFENDFRIKTLKDLNIKSCSKNQLIQKTKDLPLFDISNGTLLYLAKLADIDVY